MSWRSCTVGDFIERGIADIQTGPFGTQLRARDYVDEGIPVINVRNIGFGSLKTEKLEFITAETAERLSVHLLRTGDIVFGRKGAVERHLFVNQDQEGWLQGSDCMRLRFNTSEISSSFISYAFLSRYHQQWMIINASSKATMPSLNHDVIKRIPLQLPPPAVQIQIAGILAAYDDLIKNNLQRMALLEEAARQLYREWFVRLRFPSHEHTRLVNGVPDGWENYRISDFGRVITGKTPSTKEADNYGDEIPFIKTPDMHGNVFVIETEAQLTEKGANTQPGKYLPHDALLVSCIGTIGVVALTSMRSQCNQQINAVVPFEECFRYYCFFAFKDLKQQMEAMGGGATMGNVNKTKFENLKVLRPKISLLRDFDEFCAPIFRQILVLALQNQKLRAARDLLLPKLMSGEIAV